MEKVVIDDLATVLGQNGQSTKGSKYVPSVQLRLPAQLIVSDV